MSDASDEFLPPIPEARALQGATGTPVTLGDGNTWLLADGGLCNALDRVRDRVDDEARLSGKVPMVDVLEAAWVLLVANYDLTRAEVYPLLAGCDRKALVAAVMEALFGPGQPRRTYTAWAASALLANGIDPASVPGDLRPHVLAQLVQTRRAIPLDQYVESAEAGGRMAGLRALAAMAKPAPAGE